MGMQEGQFRSPFVENSEDNGTTFLFPLRFLWRPPSQATRTGFFLCFLWRSFRLRVLCTQLTGSLWITLQVKNQPVFILITCRSFSRSRQTGGNTRSSSSAAPAPVTRVLRDVCRVTSPSLTRPDIDTSKNTTSDLIQCCYALHVWGIISHNKLVALQCPPSRNGV